MLMKRLLNFGVGGLVAMAIIFGLVALPSRAADHLDAPFVKMDGRMDINDVYVFHPSQNGSQDLSRTVLAMTVNPAAGAISPATFRKDAVYQILIDKDGDAEPDLNLTTIFSDVRPDGRQRYTVTMQDKDNLGLAPVIARGSTERTVEGSNGVKVFAGLRDDPFFFDLNSFNDGATFCEEGDSDFFLGLNVSAIVIEVPTSLLGEGQVGVWGRTGDILSGLWDRMGRPAILTVFIPPNPFEPSPPDPELEDAFNYIKPENDLEATHGSRLVRGRTQSQR